MDRDAKRRVLLRFSRREDFGAFCVELNKTDLPFTLNGSLGVVMLHKHYELFSKSLKKLVAAAEVTDFVPGPGKHPPSPPVSEVEATLYSLGKAHLR